MQGPRGEKGEQGPSGPTRGGIIYVRWGNSSCPSAPGTELVYNGITAGSLYQNSGGGANYLCMPHNPQYGEYQPGVQGQSPIHGTEYQINAGGPLVSVHNHNVPCAVCYVSTRVIVLMLPARLECPSSNWTLEYAGYLMSEQYTHHRTTHICVDENPGVITNSAADSNGALLYHTEVVCNGLPCGPYDPEKELTCAVCTK